MLEEIKWRETIPTVSPEVIVRKKRQLKYACILMWIGTSSYVSIHWKRLTKLQRELTIPYILYYQTTSEDSEKKVSKRIEKYLTLSTAWDRYWCQKLPFGLALIPGNFQDMYNKGIIEKCA